MSLDLDNIIMNLPLVNIGDPAIEKKLDVSGQRALQVGVPSPAAHVRADFSEKCKETGTVEIEARWPLEAYIEGRLSRRCSDPI